MAHGGRTVAALARLGGATVGLAERGPFGLATLGDVSLSLGRWLARRERLPAGQLADGLDRTGPRIAVWPVVVGLAVGVAIGRAIDLPLHEAQRDARVPELLARLALRDLGPLLAAFFMAAEIAPAVAAEVQRRPGTSLAPVLLSCTVTGPLLVVYVAAALLVGGALGATTPAELGWLDYLDVTSRSLGPAALSVAAAQGLAFAWVVVLSAGAEGRWAARRGFRPGEAGRAAFQTSLTLVALVQSAFVVLEHAGVIG